MVASTPVTKPPVRGNRSNAAKADANAKDKPEIAEDLGATNAEPEILIHGPQAPVHGKLIVNLYQGNYRLSVFQDSTMNTFVVYHNDLTVGVIRGHRRCAISTFGLHVSVIARLAVNVSEESASEYLNAAAFFDNNLQAYTAKQPHYVDLQYSYTTPSDGHTGYMFIAGKNVAFDDEITEDAKEILFRAMPYIKNFCDRYENIQPEVTNSLLDTPHLGGGLNWK